MADRREAGDVAMDVMPIVVGTAAFLARTSPPPVGCASERPPAFACEAEPCAPGVTGDDVGASDVLAEPLEVGDLSWECAFVDLPDEVIPRIAFGSPAPSAEVGQLYWGRPPGGWGMGLGGKINLGHEVGADALRDAPQRAARADGKRAPVRGQAGSVAGTRLPGSAGMPRGLAPGAELTAMRPLSGKSHGGAGGLDLPRIVPGPSVSAPAGSRLTTLTPTEPLRAGRQSWAAMIGAAIAGEAGLLWLAVGLALRRRARRRRRPPMSSLR
jgi:hypothetical protein